MTAYAIPVISLAADDATIASEVRAACTTMGFFYIVDHGIPPALVAGTFEWAARFFAQPAAAKQAVALKANRGWEGVGAQTLDAGAKPDQKESFYSGIDHAPDHPYVQAGYHGYGSNLWPATLPGFAEHMTAYTEAHIALCERLMRHLARSLDLAPDYFDSTMGYPLATLRLCRYPPHPENATADTFGAGAHTDWGAITTLAQDQHGGLEVQAPDGSWIAATPVPDSFVVNLGDMIPRWTNGRYRSNLHRVINKSTAGRDRYSIPFFYSPDYLARIAAVPGTVAPGETPRFAACTAGEHLLEMYRKSYGIAA
jgi:isopenicillin N synthase-like dioxygenase